MEFCLKLTSGMYIHLFKSNFVNENYFEKRPVLEPSVPSCVFTFSVLCVLSKIKCRNFINSPPPWLVQFLVEYILTLYLSDVAMRIIWIPCTYFGYWCCDMLCTYLENLNKGYYAGTLFQLVKWLKLHAFYMKYGLSILIFYSMIHVTGASVILSKFISFFSRSNYFLIDDKKNCVDENNYEFVFTKEKMEDLMYEAFMHGRASSLAQVPCTEEVLQQEVAAPTPKIQPKKSRSKSVRRKRK